MAFVAARSRSLPAMAGHAAETNGTRFARGLRDGGSRIRPAGRQRRNFHSFMVCDSIFDALYTYDYLRVRRASCENTAAGMPKSATTGALSRSQRSSPFGIFFADDPAFKRQAARAHRRGRYVYSIKRIARPRVHRHRL